MKKLFSIMAIAILSLALVGCDTEDKDNNIVELPAAVTDYKPDASPINMENIDQYLGRSDVQYVDLRGFNDKLVAGYINGFGFIPFFEFLDGRIVEGRTDLVYSADLVNEDFAFSNYFDEDKAIFLMCASGGRAGYVKQILDAQGYTTYNVGGFGTYSGENKVLGDSTYDTGAEE